MLNGRGIWDFVAYGRLWSLVFGILSRWCVEKSAFELRYEWIDRRILTFLSFLIRLGSFDKLFFIQFIYVVKVVLDLVAGSYSSWRNDAELLNVFSNELLLVHLHPSLITFGFPNFLKVWLLFLYTHVLSRFRC